MCIYVYIEYDMQKENYLVYTCMMFIEKNFVNYTSLKKIKKDLRRNFKYKTPALEISSSRYEQQSQTRFQWQKSYGHYQQYCRQLFPFNRTFSDRITIFLLHSTFKSVSDKVRSRYKECEFRYYRMRLRNVSSIIRIRRNILAYETVYKNT